MKVIYTEKLNDHLKMVDLACKELIKEEEPRTVEQFLAEIESIKQMLEDSKELISLRSR